MPSRWHRTIAAAALVVCYLGAIGPGSEGRGPPTDERPIATVALVELNASGTLTLTVGPTPRLRITARRDALDHLTSQTRRSRLILGSDRTSDELGEVRYALTLPDARGLILSGAGIVQASGVGGIKGVELSGSGHMRIAGLNTQRLQVRLPGTGTVTLAGTATQQVVLVSGPGRYNGRALASRVGEVTVEGSGTAAVRVSSTLRAVVEGSGTVTYSGGAKVRGFVAGSGRIAGE
jgi:hypothetical protein